MQNKPFKQNKNIQHTDRKTYLAQQFTYYQGAIPDPESMERYDSISPGFALRLLSMAEKEGDDRRKKGNRFQIFSFILSTLSILCALASVGSICVLVYFAFQFGFGTQGATIATGVIVSLAYVFMGVRKKSDEGKKK